MYSTKLTVESHAVDNVPRRIFEMLFSMSSGWQQRGINTDAKQCTFFESTSSTRPFLHLFPHYKRVIYYFFTNFGDGSSRCFLLFVQLYKNVTYLWFFHIAFYIELYFVIRICLFPKSLVEMTSLLRHILRIACWLQYPKCSHRSCDKNKAYIVSFWSMSHLTLWIYSILLHLKRLSTATHAVIQPCKIEYELSCAFYCS